MGVIDSLRKPKPIMIHPDARKNHPIQFSAWAGGGVVGAKNPETGQFEKVDVPTFVPDVAYIVLTESPFKEFDEKCAYERGVTEGKAEAKKEAASISLKDTQRFTGMFVRPSGIPVAQMKRGQVWQANNGNKYLVLGDKNELIDGYKDDISDDSVNTRLICLRYDGGVAQTVSYRNHAGVCTTNNQVSFARLVNVVNLSEVEIKTDRDMYLYTRPNGRLFLSPTTGDVFGK